MKFSLFEYLRKIHLDSLVLWPETRWHKVVDFLLNHVYRRRFYLTNQLEAALVREQYYKTEIARLEKSWSNKHYMVLRLYLSIILKYPELAGTIGFMLHGATEFKGTPPEDPIFEMSDEEFLALGIKYD